MLGGTNAVIIIDDSLPAAQDAVGDIAQLGCQVEYYQIWGQCVERVRLARTEFDYNY